MSGMSAFLLIASLVVQTAAAVTAVIIALRTGRVEGWLLLAIAMAMMALRRLASLAAPLEYRDYIAEGLALVTSILAVLGVILISGAFRRFHVSGEKLKKELQENERNRKMLEEREREYRTLVNNLPGFAYRCANDRDWTMLYISEGCTEVTGYSPEELLGNCMVAFNDLIDEEFQGLLDPVWLKRIPLFLKYQEMLLYIYFNRTNDMDSLTDRQKEIAAAYRSRIENDIQWFGKMEI